jgi:hypothetical protein
MSITIHWTPVLSFAAAIAVCAGHQAQLFSQEFSQRRFGGARVERLPPPERPNAATEGPELISPRGSDASARTGRPYLGITFDPNYPDAAVAQSVVPGGPAEQAGIQPGDTIQAINDYAVSSYRDAHEIVAALEPGEIIDIDYSRRISGRTQAVLGDGPTQGTDTTNDSGEDIDRAYPERPASFQSEELPVEERRPVQPRSLRENPVEERLPEPTYYRDYRRSSQTQLSSARSDPRLNYNGVSDDRSEPPERQIIIERRRPAERGFRGRRLLPWRRN